MPWKRVKIQKTRVKKFVYQEQIPPLQCFKTLDDYLEYYDGPTQGDVPPFMIVNNSYISSEEYLKRMWRDNFPRCGSGVARKIS